MRDSKRMSEMIGPKTSWPSKFYSKTMLMLEEGKNTVKAVQFCVEDKKKMTFQMVTHVITVPKDIIAILAKRYIRQFRPNDSCTKTTAHFYEVL